MAVSSYLKVSVCLMILISLSASTRANDTSDCQIGCSISESQTDLAACVSKCKEFIVTVPFIEKTGRYRGKAENRDGYEDPPDGLRLKKKVIIISEGFVHSLSASRKRNWRPKFKPWQIAMVASR